MQITIDELADEMMQKYNKERICVYNTFQMYRHDKLEFLKSSHAKALKGQIPSWSKIGKRSLHE